MGKKKRGHANVEDILERSWCYYCERDFEDLKLLISHQKAKHFKCDRCGRRLNTAGGLSVHLNQVHKETLDQVENALPNRQGLEVEIFGMEGIPQEALDQHRNRIIQNFYQAQEDRRIATGNPLPGHGGDAEHARKKVKVETKEELLRRLADHRVRRKTGGGGGAMEGVAATGSGGAEAVQHNAEQQQGYAQQPYGSPTESMPAQAPGHAPQQQQQPPQQQGDDIDQLIRMAEAGAKPPAAAATAAADDEKKASKKGRMVYDDAETSPEERMAALPRYVFRPEVAA